MILSVHNLCKSFDGKDILKNASFHMENNEKAAIVGINGAGKTTLIKMIIGELTPDDGEITFSKGITWGYLAQNQNIDTTNSIMDELTEVKRDIIELEENIREAEEAMKHVSGDELTDLMNKYTQMNEKFQRESGYAWKSEVLGVAKGLGFTEEEFDKKISNLSGGQKTRVCLGKLLLQKPDLIILDEPTNHLDMNSIRWLENYLLNYKGAVLIVSHDRYFLDKIAGKIIEVENTKVSSFTGNYSTYAVKKEQVRATQWHAYMKQQQEIKHQEEVIAKLKSFNREKSIKRAESREKMLDKIEVLDKPITIDDRMKISLKPNCESANDVLSVEGISKSFGNEKLFSDISFEIKKGEHVAIIGDNGTGKTTMLKMINGVESLDGGKIELGVKVHIGYYDQEHHVLHDEKTLFEEISDAYPTLNNTEIRNTLAAFLFTGDDVFKRIGDLSGGEKGRVSLAKLMLSDANFLILDEPTNHLDITSKEILETAISGYEGTVLYVSHDRYFINKTATRILDLTHGTVVNYIGNYDYYMEHADEQNNRLFGESADLSGSTLASGSFKYESSNAVATPAPTVTTANAGAADWKAQKEEQARKRKQEAALKKCEEEIAKLEARDSEINELLADPSIGTDLAKLRKLSDEQAEIQDRLATLYDEWEELSM
ncbi:MAG: ABC-F family ATP-binding cassette domain-containing protein [Butyrivibrio sp.]|jgi:ATP-binding cassette subfamily F protein 3|uniref:ABC-F family ATP-binding cassette domain-containing protein n=1 Tax=Butyrivibrio sp. TaxID=28121 RepID=UPI001ECBB76F|nr:ABC-F family ATP-binding cassette domain-containing protein [Butyrivibrio sp.]MBE5842310.1 ABC-F family ATP-binding cassette domain-containing protein [Butyrivibrio sp.]